MKKFNIILTIGIIISFFIHIMYRIFSLFELCPEDNIIVNTITWVMVVLLVSHAIIDIKLAINTHSFAYNANTYYTGGSSLQYIRHATGIALLIFIAIYLADYFGIDFNLGIWTLVSQLFMVGFLISYILLKLKSFLIEAGMSRLISMQRQITIIIIFLLSAFAISFIYHYIKWSAV